MNFLKYQIAMVSFIAVLLLFACQSFGQYDVIERQIARHKDLKQNKADFYKAVRQQTFNSQALIFDTDTSPVDVIVRRSGAMLENLASLSNAPDLTDLSREFKKLKAKVEANSSTDRESLVKLYDEVAALRRKIVFANPLLDFKDMLFIKRHFCPNDEMTGNHMCDQYFGFNAIRGGGLFILENAFTDNPTARNVLENSTCVNGRFKGRKLTEKGGFLSPELSFDGKKILFAYTDIVDEPLEYPERYVWHENNTYKIFSVNVDGTDLRQLTDGVTNDFDPCFLPSGRIAFISERRGGYGRCHGRPVPSYTLHSMNADGSDIVMLSPHETNEWKPSVDHNGMIIYTRWDYVDRGFNQAHHPWITTPDGRDSRAIQGNYGSTSDARPHMEMDIRVVPDSDKLSATAACHHGQAYGSIVLIDPSIPDDDAMAPVRRITPYQLFPEAEIGTHGPPANYASAWPLSENFYICVYDPDSKSDAGTKNNYGIYLIDAFGNSQLLWRDPKISCLDPIPLKARKTPPVIPHVTSVGKPQTEANVADDAVDVPATGQVGLVNIYNAKLPFPEGTKIKALRIIEPLPKTTPFNDKPRIGYGTNKSARAVLGTVPVEEDGSAYFNLPVDIPVYFQALDENGLAVQSMRSATYVHPGEKLICQGCHENRHAASAPTGKYPTAMRRNPSEIKPEAAGSNPFSFPLLVQPVLDKNCRPCHQKEDKAPDLSPGNYMTNSHHWYSSYETLRNHAFFYDRSDWTEPNTYPNKFGAKVSKLYNMLVKGHHDVKLSSQDMRRITLWLDSNSDFFGSYENTEAQAQGRIVEPTLR